MQEFKAYRLAVAPMMDWTDRHCRFFHRGLAPNALLYSEMVTAEAVIHGDRSRVLRFDPAEHPVALQLGGADPQKLAKAARIGAAEGYDEINLNVGCPSDRVQSGTFGACLMQTPALVGECLAAMKAAVKIPVTVKCRLGVDDQDPEEALDALADAAVEAGVDAIWVHARKAWLQGLSPKENREVPPLDYGRVYRLKARLPRIFVGINGGIATIAAVREAFAAVDGVMLGRAAWQNPALLAEADALLADGEPADRVAAAERMIPYADRHLSEGGRMSAIVRPMLGLFHGEPGARHWRRLLTEGAARPGADASLIAAALREVAAARRLDRAA